jgi:T5SS/PEP-CTERM-associated repeat protein
LITVDGIGSTLYMNNLGSATLMIGGGGNAALNVSNGGRVDTTGNISVEAFGMVTSELNINSGGTVTCASGSVGGVNGGVGVVTVANGGVLQATNLTIGANGAVRGDGTIVGSVQNGGLVSPGTSPGALNIDGNYTQTADGELLIELAASSYDQLLVTSDATLAGSLTVNLIDGFTPSIGQMFTILTADDVDGVFGTEPPPTTLNFGFNVIYNAQSVVLTVFSALPGDYNGNGTVDAADYVVWRKTDGTQPGYDTWRTHFGETVGTAGDSPSQAAVPEPATLMVLIFAAAGWSLRRGRPA